MGLECHSGDNNRRLIRVGTRSPAARRPGGKRFGWKKVGRKRNQSLAVSGRGNENIIAMVSKREIGAEPPRRYRVLLVDDDAEFVAELGEALAAAGYEVSTHTDGDAALESAAGWRPDIALIDLKMKGTSGFQVARELTRTESLAEIPIVALTGYYTRLEDEELMKLCGFKDKLIKPFPAEKAAQKLNSLLISR